MLIVTISNPFSLCARQGAHTWRCKSSTRPARGRVGQTARVQGCRGRLRIWRKPKAKRWPDEQEADRRRHGGVRRRISSKPETCTERRDVYPTGISVKVGASYPGRSAWVPRATSGLPSSRGVGRLMQKSAETIVGAIWPKGRTLETAIRRWDHTASR